MAGIVDVFNDLIARVKVTIPEFKFVHIWNNQLAQMEEGSIYSFPFPNCFIEVVPPNDYTPIGRGYSTGELVVRFHIGHEEYDAGGGNFEQNVNVFTYRDKIVNKFNNYQPIATSSLMRVSEGQDYVHTNIYHYIVEFRCAFIDSLGGWEAQHETAQGTILTLADEAQIIPPFTLGVFNNIFNYTFN